MCSGMSLFLYGKQGILVGILGGKAAMEGEKMGNKLRLYGFNNLTKALSFNIYDVCYALSLIHIYL